MNFVGQVEDYVSLRRGLGSRLDGQSKILLDFGRFLDRVGHRGPITVEVTLRWAEAPRSSDPARTAQRVGTVRGFLRHRCGFDPATEVPPPQLLGSAIRRKPPHIYSPAEVNALLHACRKLRPAGGLRAHTYETLFSLLLCTGLRISEALHLELGDVDLHNDLLTVRDGKSGKSRIIALHPTAGPPLARYLSRHGRTASKSTTFFRTQLGASLSYSAVRMTFARLRDRLEWTPAGRARLPRIQDMRHTFAVRCLVRWYRDGIHPDRKIAHLATYLGHTEVRDTYWYLSAVPELSSLAIDRFERFALGVPGGDS